MSEEFDIEEVSGHEYMDEDDISYFKKFGNSMADQTEIIMDQYNIDSETMRDACAWYMNNLMHDQDMYLVEGASLACSMQDDSVHYLNSESGSITSQIDDEQVVEMSTLKIVENRKANIRYFIPAVVTDAKGGIRDKAQNHISINDENSLNIVSFGNCKNIPDGAELETLAKEIHKSIPYQNDAWSTDRILYEMKKAIEQGKGICHCCMLLNPEWENLPIEYDFSTGSFKESRDPRILPIGGLDQSYQQINGKEQINMMSMLFCQHGGIITAQKSGQINYLEEYVTRNMLESVGFKEMTDKSIKELNLICHKFGITSLEEIRHIISQCVVESYKGLDLTEINWSKGYHNSTKEEDEVYFNKIYGSRQDLGNCEDGAGYRFRGAGYIHLTGRANYQAFSDYLEKEGRGDARIMQEGADVIASDYAWEAAAWYWKNHTDEDGKNGTDLVDEGSSVKEITFFVNGGYNGLEAREEAYSKFAAD